MDKPESMIKEASIFRTDAQRSATSPVGVEVVLFALVHQHCSIIQGPNPVGGFSQNRTEARNGGKVYREGYTN
jgi:hypothetical protein